MRLSPAVTAVFCAVLSLSIAGTTAQADIITSYDLVTGFSGGDSFTPQDFTQLTDGIGFIKPDPADPSTWTDNSAAYPQEWYDHPLAGATNSKLGWLAVNVGSNASFTEELYIFNGRYNGGSGSLGSDEINVYYASSPTVALPSPPGGNSAVDYDFASGGWTLLTNTNIPNAGVAVIDLTSISAPFIGIEILSTQPGDARTGFDEIAITIPEPASLALLSLGGLLIAGRQRRKA